MLNSIHEAKRSEFDANILPALVFSFADQRREAYERNRHHVYALAFWMTDNELAAEELMSRTFSSAFAKNNDSTTDEIDQALVTELRQSFNLGVFTLNCSPCTQIKNVRGNTMRVDLERAVVQLPATEKLIFLLHDVERYQHNQIARLLAITERESHLGLHQARLRMRELLTK